jgi:hypothetical protein
MPTVKAGDLPYQPYNSEEPSTQVPSAYQNIRSTGADFGETIGAATEKLGAVIGQGANVLAEGAIERQKFENRVRADDATNNYNDVANKLLYGDPDKPGDTGFFGMKGENAVRALPDVRNQLLKLRDQIGAGLANPYQKLLFNSETRMQQSITMARMGAHYDSESKTYAVAVATAKDKNAGAALGQALAEDNDPAAQFAVKQKMDAALDKLKVQGLDQNPDAVTAALQGVRSDYVKQKISILEQKDPVAALNYFENESNALVEADIIPLRNHLRAKAQAYQAEINAGNLPGVTSSERARGGARALAPGPHAQEATDTFKKAGWSDAAIEGALHNGLAEGGFDTNKKPGDGGTSFGHWQYHRGGELEGYERFAGGDWSTKKQAEYLIQRMEEIRPGFGQIQDPRLATNIIEAEFERPAVVTGSRYAGPVLPGIPRGMAHTEGDAITSNAKAPAGAGDYVAVGDSIAAHLIRKAGVGGKEYNFEKRGDSTAVSGWGPAAINNMIAHLPDSQVKGKDVVLSTGASNVVTEGPLNESNLAVIGEQIDKLKARGAKSVTVLGLGTRQDLSYGERNEQLAQLAVEHQARFTGAIDPKNVAGDQVHVKNPAALFDQVRKAQPTESVATGVSGGGAPEVRLAAAGGDPVVGPTGKPLPKLDFPLPNLQDDELPDAQVPGMAERLEMIQKNVPADDVVGRQLAVQAARKQLNQQYRDQQRSLTAAKAQAHEAMEKREAQIYKDVYSGNPSITPQDVATDPTFDTDNKRRKTMIDLINDPPGSKIPPAQSTAMRQYLLDRMRLPEGDSQRITSDSQIYEQSKRMNKEDLDWLLKKHEDIRGPDGAKLAKEEDRFIKSVKGFLTKSNPLGTTVDPIGDQRLGEYQTWIGSRISEYKKEGKNPVTLFDPTNPDYVGKPDIIKHYQPTMEESQRSVQEWSKGGLLPLPPAGPYKGPALPKGFSVDVPPAGARGAPVVEAPIPPLGAGSIPARLPGETPDAYEERLKNR